MKLGKRLQQYAFLGHGYFSVPPVVSPSLDQCPRKAYCCRRFRRGFTLIEAVVGTALFLIVALAVYQVYVGVFNLIYSNQDQILAIDVANEQFEIARNMPYASVGVQGGLPSGVIPEFQTLSRGGVPFNVTTIVRSINIPLGSTGVGSTSSTSPSEKLIAVTVTCVATSTCSKNFNSLTLTTDIAPANLITDSTDGALSIKAFNANGIPIVGANVIVTNGSTTDPITVNDTTNNSGYLQILGVPPASNVYHIVVTEPGYSTDQNYPASSTNLHPTVPYATVLSQQITSTSFSIDQTGTLSISTVAPSCALVPNVGFTIVGSKTIGPGVPKYTATTTTSVGGTDILNNMEWDAYTFGLNSSSYDLEGVNILNPVELNPAGSQNILLTVLPKTPDSLQVTVKDGSTGLPLSNASVTLAQTSPFYSNSLTTGQGYFAQTDWSGGSGQSNYINTNQFFSSNGNINISPSSPATGILLAKNGVGGTYAPSGLLQSSTFDTGTSSSFINLVWLPGSQPLAVGTTSVELQLATSPFNTSTTTWNFLGPDGTAGTYYTNADASIGNMHNGDRYLRYQVLLNTPSATNTPDVSSVAFTYSTACTPPGQVLFQGLSAGTYTLTTSAVGYVTNVANVSIGSSWVSRTVVLTP
jgi:prepilin-type N-terminal cleavage/methylation domain-containing protein